MSHLLIALALYGGIATNVDKISTVSVKTVHAVKVVSVWSGRKLHVVKAKHAPQR